MRNTENFPQTVFWLLPSILDRGPCGACMRNSACRKSATLQGEPISARIRGTEIPSPWWLRFPAFAAPVAAGLQKADRCPCSASAVSSAGRASASQSLGTKLSAEPRTRRKAARTLSALNFPVCVPSIRTCRLDGTFLTVWRNCLSAPGRHAGSFGSSAGRSTKDDGRRTRSEETGAQNGRSQTFGTRYGRPGRSLRSGHQP